jgi:alanyl-tRNA synthetase
MKDNSYTAIRQAYLDFMKEKGHTEIPNASLVPENDPSILFINAGMAPLVPYLKGEKHPAGEKLTNVQRCLRTIDLDEVGDEWHCTVFEMLGNWSLDDYFKKEAINLTIEFYTEVLGLDINKIYASVFKGDNTAPQDEDSIKVWQEIFNKYGIEAKVGKGEKIQSFGKKENWWELESGGPCGPDSEIFYDTGKEPCGPDCNVTCNCGKYVEIGNNVFMEYLKEENNYRDLGRHNVDFGGGLVRIAGLLQGVDSYYEVDIFKPIMDKVNKLSQDPNIKSKRILADNIYASTMIIMDGVVPGRNEREYVLRRLIRRAVRHGKLIGIEKDFTKDISEVCIDQFKNLYSQLAEKKEKILNTIHDEEIKFKHTLKAGEKKFTDLIESQKNITGEDAFYLYETYGYPLELVLEMANEHGLKLNEERFKQDFNQAQDKHREKSRSSSVDRFKGGLADTSEMSTKYHTATHLLLAALRQVLGDDVYQKGSNITPERLRFDFPADQKLTPEQMKEVEDIVNEHIQRELPVSFKEMKKEDAMKIVPGAAFAEKYGDVVKVYTIGPEDDPFSIEICGGPHVENTSQLGKFKIIKQENVGAGVKRIKAVLE